MFLIKESVVRFFVINDLNDKAGATFAVIDEGKIRVFEFSLNSRGYSRVMTLTDGIAMMERKSVKLCVMEAVIRLSNNDLTDIIEVKSVEDIVKRRTELMAQRMMLANTSETSLEL